MKNENNKKASNLSLDVAYGFAIGVLAGIIISNKAKDLTLWLSVGIGAGIVIGTGIGAAFLRINNSLIPS